MRLTEDQLQTVYARVDQRAPKMVVGFAPAIPLYAFCRGVPEDGVLLRYMFVVPGKLTKVGVYASGVDSKAPIRLRAELLGQTTGQYVDLEVRKETSMMDVDISVDAGSRLVLMSATVWPNDLEVCALFVPELGIGAVHKVLKEALNEGIQQKTEVVSEQPS